MCATVVAWAWLASYSPESDTKAEDDGSSIANEFRDKEEDDVLGEALRKQVKQENENEETLMAQVKQEKHEDDDDILGQTMPVRSCPLSNQTNMVREEEHNDLDNSATIPSLSPAEDETVGATTQSQREDRENEQEEKTTRHRSNQKRDEE